MRSYTKLDMFRMAKLARKNRVSKAIELVQLYDNEYPEILEKQKTKNLLKALGLKNHNDEK